ncbi:hypothetical protein [Burkholderia sp. PU8-34]
MADKLIGTAFSRAKGTQARRYAATSKDVARLMDEATIVDDLDTGDERPELAACRPTRSTG